MSGRIVLFVEDVIEVRKQHANNLNDPKFMKLADQAFVKIIRDRGGTRREDYQPGDLMIAASRAVKFLHGECKE